MPVPPTFQPEVAARALHSTAHHCRREVYVGLPTAHTVIGTASTMAGVARTAIDRLQTLTVQRRPGGRPLCAWGRQHKVGAHGGFDHRHSAFFNQSLQTAPRHQDGWIADRPGQGDGDIQWPRAGSYHGDQWGIPMAAAGETYMAAVRLPLLETASKHALRLSERVTVLYLPASTLLPTPPQRSLSHGRAGAR